ncbi:MAG TPA: patatin-like phospholipase family protein, partial [Verrucomicrobiae bacterium]|nr:patatin-like phospholipase family protein [Verrucomicrobiae bacterium]
MTYSNNKPVENVLVLQGGGSLGAFECGVYKALVKNNFSMDIIAGTSIGGINAAMISGSKNKERTEELLENFWLELSESYIDFDKHFFLSPSFHPTNRHSSNNYFFPFNTKTTEKYFRVQREQEIKAKQNRS